MLVFIMILAVILAILVKYIQIGSIDIVAVENGAQAKIDDMQRAVLPEVILFNVLFSVLYFGVQYFFGGTYYKFVILFQIILILILTIKAIFLWRRFKKLKL